MEANKEIIKINSEESAWNTIKGLLDNTIDAENVTLDLQELDWVSAHFNYKGDNYNKTITPSMMKGLLEYQNDFYRSAALLLKDDARVTRLTDIEKSKLQFVFSVEEGSSDILSKVTEQIQAIGGEAFKKMTGKQILIGFLVLIVLYFGHSAGVHYIDSLTEASKIELESKRIEAEQEDQRQLYDFLRDVIKGNGDKTKVLNKAFKESSYASTIGDHSSHAMEELLKNTDGVDALTIQNVKFPKEVIRQITRSHRSSSKNLVLKQLFLVEGVVSKDSDAYIVNLKKIDSDEIITATLEDPLVESRYQNAISKAEWSRTPVMVHIVGRQVGDHVRDAKITKAYKPRKKK